MKRRHHLLLEWQLLLLLLHFAATCHSFLLPQQFPSLSSNNIYLQWKSPTSQQQEILLLQRQQASLASLTSRHVTNIQSLLQRRSFSNIQTSRALFGMGGAEIAVVLVVVVLVLGPNQLGKMTGNMTGRAKGGYEDWPDEWKRIPQEFQKGLEESTDNARARNAKPMERVPENEEEDDKK
jgi:Sec-independent protein translocase protein TatA